MTSIRTALAAGLVIALVYELPDGLREVLNHGLREGLTAGTQEVLGVWLAIGLGFVLVTDLGTRFPQQRERRRWWNKTELRATLVAGLAVGLAVLLISGLIVGITARFLGSWSALAHGLKGGFIFALGYGFAVGLGRRSRQQPGQLQSDRPIIMAAIIGLVIAIQVDFALGFAFLVVVGLGGRTPRRLGRRRWNRTDRRTTLAAGLVAGLVAGLGAGLAFGAGAGLAVGLVFGLVFGVLTWLGQPSTEAASPIDPRSLWYRERQFGLVVGLGIGLVVGLLLALRSEFPNAASAGPGPVIGLIAGLALEVGLGTWLVSSATWTAALAFAQLRRRSGTPMRLLRFLDDARDRQVLRAVGPVYQFRHARLQDRLADMCNVLPSVGATTGSRSGSPPGLAPLTHGLDHR
ncbi:MAG: hypothetical protein ACRDRS_17945 [Pseudonocardiaceae bacterium]